MPAPVIQAIGYILAVIFAGVALYYWRRSTSLYSLLVEGANRFEEIRQRNQLLETTLSKAETKFSMHKDQFLRLEKSGDEARNRVADLLKKLETREHEARLNGEKFDLQRNYFEKQLQKFQEQFKASEESKARIEILLAKSTKDLQTQTAVLVEEQKLAVRNLELQLRDKELALAEIESKMQQSDPEELRKLRRRIAQYERLYGSMRGLKEMTEERNRNWEVALKKLSNWILVQRGLSEHEIPKNIGPMVADALQAIGTQLIDDNELDTEHHGASSSNSMDFSDMDANDLEAKLVAESERFSYNDPAFEALNNLEKTELEKT
jgi:hypothetical protein